METIEERANRMAGWMLRRESMLKACNLPKVLKEMLEEQNAIAIAKAEDIYCEVCGHYPHTTPNHICRQACDYYKTFHIRLMKALEE